MLNPIFFSLLFNSAIYLWMNVMLLSEITRENCSYTLRRHKSKYYVYLLHVLYIQKKNRKEKLEENLKHTRSLFHPIYCCAYYIHTILMGTILSIRIFFYIHRKKQERYTQSYIYVVII